MRHTRAKPTPLKPAGLTEKQMLAIERHVTRHVGKSRSVWHEIVSERLHLDIIPVEPSKKHPFQTFVTMGMSAVPMTLPDGFKGARRLELCVVLPASWPTDEKSLKAKNERYWWPFRGLKEMARFPSTYDTFLGVGHTVNHGEPPAPFARSCKFVSWMVIGSVLPDSFAWLEAQRFKVQFLQIVPLYREELQLKLEEGFTALVERFEAAGLDPVSCCDPKRPNVGRRKSPRAPRAR